MFGEKIPTHGKILSKKSKGAPHHQMGGNRSSFSQRELVPIDQGWLLLSPEPFILVYLFSPSVSDIPIDWTRFLGLGKGLARMLLFFLQVQLTFKLIKSHLNYRLELLWLTMTQFYTYCELEFLPVYVPTEEEKLNPKLFAKNVRDVMAK